MDFYEKNQNEKHNTTADKTKDATLANVFGVKTENPLP